MKRSAKRISMTKRNAPLRQERLSPLDSDTDKTLESGIIDCNLCEHSAQSTVEMDVMVAFEQRTTAGLRCQQAQGFSSFLLLLSGSTRIRSRGEIFRLAAKSLVHLPAGQPYSSVEVRGRPLTYYVLRYRAKILHANQMTKLAEAGVVQWKLNPSLVRYYRSNLQDMRLEQMSRREGWETVLMARVLELGVQALRLRRHQDIGHLTSNPGGTSLVRVGEYVCYLNTHFFEPQNLDQAACTTGLSRRRFTELFREITGETFHRYISTIRLKVAQQLLLQTNRLVTTIAYECGFEDVSHFNHVFKERVGCAPSAYRKSRRAVSLPDRAFRNQMIVGI